MYRIFGLGNIGDEYKNTPHNIGKEVLENFLDNNKLCFIFRSDKKRKSKIFQGKISTRSHVFVGMHTNDF